MKYYLLALMLCATPVLAEDERRGFVTIDIEGISERGKTLEGHAWVQPGAARGDFCVSLEKTAVRAGTFSTRGNSKIRRMHMVCSNGMRAVAEMEMAKTRLFGLYWPTKGTAQSADGDRSELAFSLPGLNYFPPECRETVIQPIPVADGASRDRQPGGTTRQASPLPRAG